MVLEHPISVAQFMMPNAKPVQSQESQLCPKLPSFTEPFVTLPFCHFLKKNLKNKKAVQTPVFILKLSLHCSGRTFLKIVLKCYAEVSRGLSSHFNVFLYFSSFNPKRGTMKLVMLPHHYVQYLSGHKNK